MSDGRAPSHADLGGREVVGVQEPTGVQGQRGDQPDRRDPVRELADAPTYLSLFSGIGGLDLAVEALGYRCGGQVEWDADCAAVLRRWWPDVPRWGDVRAFEHAFEVDLVCGGFPCQPVSQAGRRQGSDDERWLWPEFARVLRLLRPGLVIVENVPGLLVRGMGEVLGDLAALGFDARWTSVRASDIGACHRRSRVFIVAHAPGRRLGATGSRLRSPGAFALGRGRPVDGDPRAFDWGPHEAAIRRHERTLGRAAPHPVDDEGRLDQRFVEFMMMFPDGWTAELSRPAALRALGNAVVWPQALAAFELLEVA